MTDSKPEPDSPFRICVEYRRSGESRTVEVFDDRARAAERILELVGQGERVYAAWSLDDEA